MTEAARRKGPTGDNLITLLESRLDNIVWRLGFAPTIPQLVKWLYMVTFRSTVKKLIAQVPSTCWLYHFIREKSRQQEWVRQRLELATSRVLPEYLNNDLATASGEVTQAPVRTDLPFTVDIQKVVEYYSQNCNIYNMSKFKRAGQSPVLHFSLCGPV